MMAISNNNNNNNMMTKRRRSCSLSGTCSVVLLVTASCLCLWKSWSSTSAATRSISSSSKNDKVMAQYSTIDNINDELPSIVSRMATLASQTNATCNHSSGINDVEWMVAVQAGSLRTNIALKEAIQTPNSLLFSSDYNVTHYFQVCRRDCCVAGGICLEETFELKLLSSDMIILSDGSFISNRQACKTILDVSQSLQHGAWEHYDTTVTKQERWKSSKCQLPHEILSTPPLSIRKRHQLLFIGDSTIQELALLTAQAFRTTPNTMGVRKDVHLNCTCPTNIGSTANYPGSTKDCRTFDAVGTNVNTSMLWAGHVDCYDNRMGVTVVDSVEWKSVVVRKVQQFQPSYIFIQVPISHSCVDMDSCLDALDRYICFLTSLQSLSCRVILLITGAAISRFQSEGPTGRHCPTALRKWMTRIKQRMQVLAPSIPILDIFTPTEQWLNLTSEKDPFVPACRSMQRHLTCDFTSLDFRKAIDSPFYVLPPGRLAVTAILNILELDDGTESAAPVSTNECQAMLEASYLVVS